MSQRQVQKRRKKLLRDNGHCEFCGVPLTTDTGTIDHIHPRSRGGKNRKHNLALCCRLCAIRKRDTTPAELLAWSVRVFEVQLHKLALAAAEGGQV